MIRIIYYVIWTVHYTSSYTYFLKQDLNTSIGEIIIN